MADSGKLNLLAMLQPSTTKTAHTMTARSSHPRCTGCVRAGLAVDAAITGAQLPHTTAPGLQGRTSKAVADHHNLGCISLRGQPDLQGDSKERLLTLDLHFAQ